MKIQMGKKELILRIAASIFGDVLIALGITFAKIANLGLDPFNGMCMSVANVVGLAYPLFTWGINLLLFVAMFVWGRRYINIGTFINWFSVSYVVDLFLNTKESLGIPSPAGIVSKIITLAIGLIIISLGIAVYQEADLGVAPYDAAPIIFCDLHPKFPFFWARMIEDSVCALIIVLTGSDLIGIGTLIIALGLGPIINTFTVIIRKLIPNTQRKNAA